MPDQFLQTIDAQTAVLRSSAAKTEGTCDCARTIQRVDWIYHSNAIDGATLTLRETRAIIEGTTLRHRSVRDHFRVLNHLVAILYVEDLIAKQEALR